MVQLNQDENEVLFTYFFGGILASTIMNHLQETKACKFTKASSLQRYYKWSSSYNFIGVYKTLLILLNLKYLSGIFQGYYLDFNQFTTVDFEIHRAFLDGYFCKLYT